MAFQEKSAWVMAFTILLGGIYYFGMVMSSADGVLAPGAVVHYTILMVCIASIGQILIAIFAPKDAQAPLDEREREIFNRAGYWSGHVSSTGVLISLMAYLFTNDGNLLFYTVFGSFMLGELAEYVLQIVLYRRAV
jgi:hypothetical protein